MIRTTSSTMTGRDEHITTDETPRTMIGDLAAVGRELDESELLAVTGGHSEPLLGDPTGGSCGGCH